MHPIPSQAPTSPTSETKHALLSLSNVPALDANFPLPYTASEQTPTRFLASCSKMELDIELNPFEQSFGAGTSSSSSSAEGPITGLMPTTLSALINYGGSVVKTPGSLDVPTPTLPPLAAISSTSATYPSELIWGQGSLRLGPLSPAMLLEPQKQPLPSPSTGYLIGTASPAPLFFNKATASMDSQGTVTPSRFDIVLVPPLPVHDFPQQNPLMTAQMNGPISSYPGSDAQKSLSIDFSPSATSEEGIPSYPRDAGVSVPATASADGVGLGCLPPRHSYSSTSTATWSSRKNSMHPHPSSIAASYPTTDPMVTVATDSSTKSSTRKRKAPSRRAASRSGSPKSPRRRSSASAVTRSSSSAKNRRKGSSSTFERRSPSLSLPVGDEAEPYVDEPAPESTFDMGIRRQQVATNGSGITGKYTHASRSTTAAAENVPNGANHHSSGSEEGLDQEDKRKSFLERNRQAALKCRQRKKQWLHCLQDTVDNLSTENQNLQRQATTLREEIINLKTLLFAHKECPVAQANGVMGLDINNAAGPTVGVDVEKTNISSARLSTALNGSQQMVPRTIPPSHYERGTGFFDGVAPTTNFPRQQAPSNNLQEPGYKSQSEAAPPPQYSATSNCVYPRRPSFTFTSHPPQTRSSISTVTGRPSIPTSSLPTSLTTIHDNSVASTTDNALASTSIPPTTTTITTTTTTTEDASRGSLERQEIINRDIVAAAVTSL